MSPGLGAGGRSRFFGGVSLRPRFFGGVWLRATAVAACCDRVGGISTPLPSFCALRRSAGDGHRCRHRYMYIAGPIRCSDSGPARARKAACGRRAGGAPRLFWYCSRAVAPTFAFGCTNPPCKCNSATAPASVPRRSWNACEHGATCLGQKGWRGRAWWHRWLQQQV